LQSNIKTGFIEKNKTLLIVIILVAGVSGALYWWGYLGFLLPNPSISLIEVNKNAEKDWQTVWEGEGMLAQEVTKCIGTNISVSFTLVNSGDIDGYVNVRLYYGDMSVDLDRYFVKGGEEVRKNLGKKVISCNIKEDNLELVYTIERS
tara:strand:- start:345 stop:788 length:444 start_codon:yes stop_codon:yes gene_type:complete